MYGGAKTPAVTTTTNATDGSEHYTDEDLLEKEAKAVYDIVPKHGVENPQSTKYTLTFCFSSDTDYLKPELTDELKEHFGEKKNDYRIGVSMNKDGEVTSVKIWYEEEFRDAWAQGDFYVETIRYGEYKA